MCLRTAYGGIGKYREHAAMAAEEAEGRKDVAMSYTHKLSLRTMHPITTASCEPGTTGVLDPPVPPFNLSNAGLLQSFATHRPRSPMRWTAPQASVACYA